MSARLSRDGKPVCPGVAIPAPPPETITLSADAPFETDNADLRPEAVAELNGFSPRMRALGKTRVYIVGHTGSRASHACNQRLSKRRAASVARYPETNIGIVSQTEGRGEREPVATNDASEGRQPSRRVELSPLD